MAQGVLTNIAAAFAPPDNQTLNQDINIQQTTQQIANARILQAYNINVNAVVTSMRVNGELGRALAGIS